MNARIHIETAADYFDLRPAGRGELGIEVPKEKVVWVLEGMTGWTEIQAYLRSIYKQQRERDAQAREAG